MKATKDNVLRIIDEVMNNREIDSIRNAILATTALPVIYWYYICSGSIVNSALLLVSAVMLNSFGEKVKILIDMRNPKIDWDNEYTMMKQNTNVMYELFYTIIVLVIIIGLGFLVSNLRFYFSVLISLLLLINLWMNDYLRIKDYKIFEKLY